MDRDRMQEIMDEERDAGAEPDEEYEEPDVQELLEENELDEDEEEDWEELGDQLAGGDEDEDEL